MTRVTKIMKILKLRTKLVSRRKAGLSYWKCSQIFRNSIRLIFISVFKFDSLSKYTDGVFYPAKVASGHAWSKTLRYLYLKDSGGVQRSLFPYLSVCENLEILKMVYWAPHLKDPVCYVTCGYLSLTTNSERANSTETPEILLRLMQNCLRYRARLPLPWEDFHIK